MTLRCAKCDSELDSDLAFCDRCGTPVGDTPAPQAFSPAAPDTAVRKTVTVLFADLGGSTSFGERTDAELARELVPTVHRPEDMLREGLPIGPPELFAEKLSAFAKAGVQRVFIWPVADEVHQFERFWNDMRPLVADT